MKYEYKIPIHPMTDTPTGTFQYVYGDMLGVGQWPPEHFLSTRCDSRANQAIGWISTKTERTPILKEGKWYLVLAGADNKAQRVMYYSNGMMHYTADAMDNLPIRLYDIISEMKEANDE